MSHHLHSFENEVNNSLDAEQQDWGVQRGLACQQPLSLAREAEVADPKTTSKMNAVLSPLGQPNPLEAGLTL